MKDALIGYTGFVGSNISKLSPGLARTPGGCEHYVNNNAEARRKWYILCGFRRKKDGFKRLKVGKKHKQKNLAAARGWNY